MTLLNEPEEDEGIGLTKFQKVPFKKSYGSFVGNILLDGGWGELEELDGGCFLRFAQSRLHCFCLEDYVPRPGGTALAARLWFALQVKFIRKYFACLLFFLLAMYVSSFHPNLTRFSQLITSSCDDARPQHFKCVGSMWELVLSQTSPASSSSAMEDEGGADWVIPDSASFEFRTSSSPPTFLMVVTPSCHARYRWTLRASDSTLQDGGLGLGTQARVFAFPQARLGGVSWNLAMETIVGLRGAKSCPFDISVFDSVSGHFSSLHEKFAGGKCSFKKTWEKFAANNEDGWHWDLRVLQWVNACLLLLLVASACLLVLIGFPVLSPLLNGTQPGTAHWLATVVWLKAILIDFGLQSCLMIYLYLWYRPDGVQCQTCVFDPEHCRMDMEPLKGPFLMSLCLLVASALMPQLTLVHAPKPALYSDEVEDFCTNIFSRGSLASLSLLPSLSGLLFFGPSVLPLGAIPVALYLVISVPVFIGWVVLACVPMVALCDLLIPTEESWP